MEPYAFERSMDRLYEEKYVSRVEVDVEEEADSRKKKSKSKDFVGIRKIYHVAAKAQVNYITTGNHIYALVSGDTLEILGSRGTENFPVCISIIRKSLGRTHPDYRIQTTFKRTVEIRPQFLA